MRLIQAIIELLEAKAENIREQTATLNLGTFARGYQEGREDALEGFEVVYIEADED